MNLINNYHNLVVKLNLQLKFNQQPNQSLILCKTMYQQYFKQKQQHVDQDKFSQRYLLHRNEKMCEDQIGKKCRLVRFRSDDQLRSKSTKDLEIQQQKRDKVKLAIKQLESCWKNLKNNNSKINLKNLNMSENEQKIPKQNVQQLQKKQILVTQKLKNQNIQINHKQLKKSLNISQQSLKQSKQKIISPEKSNQINMKHVLSACFQKSSKQNKAVGPVTTTRLIKKPLLKKQASSIINYLNRFRNSKQDKGEQKSYRQESKIKKISEFQIENIMFAKRS